MSICSTVKQFLVDDDWKYQEIDENNLKAGIKCDNSTFDIIYTCEEKNQILTVIIYKGGIVPTDSRAKAAELLTRANYNIKIGCYSLDFSDGEIRFRTGIDVEDGTLSTTMVRNMTYLAIRQLDEMYPFLMKLIYGNGDPVALHKEWLKK